MNDINIDMALLGIIIGINIITILCLLLTTRYLCIKNK